MMDRLNPEQRAAFEHLGEVMGSEVQPQPNNSKGFMSRVMDFLAGE